ncbi:hypothetical protein LSAT2_021914 [Lamellibrachia satsuma]|nr:hypothetical protein LSAT2_021914 [Lamellibrachia satsuma]
MRELRRADGVLLLLCLETVAGLFVPDAPKQPSLCSGRFNSVRDATLSLKTTASKTCQCRVTSFLYAFTFHTEVKKSGSLASLCVSPNGQEEPSPLQDTVCVDGSNQSDRSYCSIYICMQALIKRDGRYEVKLSGLSTITPTSSVKSPTAAASAVTMETTTQDKDWLTRNTMQLVYQTRSCCTDERRSTTQFVPVNDITTVSYDADAYIESTPALTHDNTGTDEGGHRDARTTYSPSIITRGTRVYPMTTPMSFYETSFSLNSQVVSGTLVAIGVVLSVISVAAVVVVVFTRRRRRQILEQNNHRRNVTS